MTGATDRLIESLVESAGPVHRLRPPAVRATLFLLAVAALGALTILLFSDLSVFARRASDPKLDWELAGTLLTGIFAVVAAFELSLPDRSPLWALLPLPPFALWVASTGYSCYRHWLAFGPDGWEIGESAQCFRFILAVGVPLGVSLLVLLRKARPLAPARVAALGGLGVAALAAFLLQFFHPFDVTFMDLSVHLVVVGLVTAVSTLAGRTYVR
ncbi:MAG TPA: NrsF family protein [Stellaceae bacterium]|nr:NrsF family protein [Stellaceae bacterium]